MAIAPLQFSDTPRIARKKLDAADADADAAADAAEYLRCVDYFRDEEPCVLRADDTLFRVHASFLVYDSPDLRRRVAAHRRSAPKYTPLRLDDSVTHVEALIWALYTHPLPAPQTVPLDTLLAVAETATKYRFAALTPWALDALAAALHTPTALRTAHPSLLPRLASLAAHTRRADISTPLQTHWAARLHRGAPPGPALAAGDAHALPHLQRHAYYVAMRALTRGDGARAGLTPRQRVHVHAGAASLAACWRRLRGDPPAFSAGTGCTRHERCVAAWGRRWAVAAAVELGPDGGVAEAEAEVEVEVEVEVDADVLRRLQWMATVLRQDGVLLECMAAKCRESALDSIVRTAQGISHNLLHHFDL